MGLLIAEELPGLAYKYMSAPRAAQLIESPQLYMAPSLVLNDLYDLDIRGFWRAALFETLTQFLSQGGFSRKLRAFNPGPVLDRCRVSRSCARCAGSKI